MPVRLAGAFMTGSTITSQEMQQYKATARRLWQTAQRQREKRQARAWELARQAAELLRRQFGVQRVVLFGSLTQAGGFTRWSDVDLAAWDLTSANWLKAIGAVRQLSDEIEVNLVDVETCSPELLAVIEAEGVPL
jgi:predicted nucleotidyltransferase